MGRIQVCSNSCFMLGLTIWNELTVNERDRADNEEAYKCSTARDFVDNMVGNWVYGTLNVESFSRTKCVVPRLRVMVLYNQLNTGSFLDVELTLCYLHMCLETCASLHR